MQTLSKIIFAIFVIGSIYLISTVEYNNPRKYVKSTVDSLGVDSIEHKTYKNYRVYPTRNHSRYL